MLKYSTANYTSLYIALNHVLSVTHMLSALIIGLQCLANTESTPQEEVGAVLPKKESGSFAVVILFLPGYDNISQSYLSN